MSKPLLDFEQVRHARGITIQAIEKQSGVPAVQEYLFEIGCPVDEATKVRLVHVLSVLAGKYYRVTDFQQGVRPSTAERAGR